MAKGGKGNKNISIVGGGKVSAPSSNIERDAIADYFREKGYTVDKQGNVTLYHATPKENVDKIKEQGFKGTSAPLAASVPEDVKPRTFFSLTKEGVWDGNKSEGYEVMQVKIPAEYIRQAGRERATEVYVENNPKNNGRGVWIPEAKATSTAFDRMIIKKYKKKTGK